MDLYYTFYIQAAPEKVWAALIEPESVKQLFYQSTLKSTFEEGSPFEFVGPGIKGEQTVHIFGKILKFNPHKEFTYSCKVSTNFGEEHANFESRVSYQLEKMGQLTKLKLIHDNWQAGDPSYENSKNGWWLQLSSLKTLVETGEAFAMTSGLHG